MAPVYRGMPNAYRPSECACVVMYDVFGSGKNDIVSGFVTQIMNPLKTKEPMKEMGPLKKYTNSYV